MKLPTYYEYRHMDNDDREKIYLRWCNQRQLTPDLETTANLWMDTLVDRGEEAPAVVRTPPPRKISTGVPEQPD